MTKEAVCAGVDVAKNTLDVAVSSCEGIRQFANDHEGITNAVRYIAGLKTAMIIVEATGGLEMPLVTALQADRLPVVVINPRQVRDFARAAAVSSSRCLLRSTTGSYKPMTVSAHALKAISRGWRKLSLISTMIWIFESGAAIAGVRRMTS